MKQHEIVDPQVKGNKLILKVKDNVTLAEFTLEQYNEKTVRSMITMVNHSIALLEREHPEVEWVDIFLMREDWELQEDQVDMELQEEYGEYVRVRSKVGCFLDNFVKGHQP